MRGKALAKTGLIIITLLTLMVLALFTDGYPPIITSWLVEGVGLYDFQDDRMPWLIECVAFLVGLLILVGVLWECINDWGEGRSSLYSQSPSLRSLGTTSPRTRHVRTRYRSR